MDIVDRENLEKMLPDNIDNVRLIIDTNAVAARHGLIVKNIKTSASGSADNANSASKINSAPVALVPAGEIMPIIGSYNTMILSFAVSSSYEAFKAFLTDLESSLRIMDISKITLSVSESSAYNYDVEIKTYWLKQ